MATIFLHDTGKLTTDSSTTESGAGSIANNGVEIPLKINSLKFGNSFAFDDSPQPGQLTEYPKLGFTSLVSPIITISGHFTKNTDVSAGTSVINKINDGTPTLTDEDGSTFTDEIKMLGLLDHAGRTRGYKELYYKAEANDNLFYGIARNTETSGDTYKCFNVRIKSLNITQSPDSSLIRWDATLVITS